MERRDFLAMSLAAAAGTAKGEGMTGAPLSREYYQLRRYALQSGPQTQITENYFAKALIPALNRLGIQPVGAFRLEYGPETPAYFLLMPCPSLATLVEVDLRLAQDAAFLKLAEAFWNAPAARPAFERVESTLLSAFEGWPKLIVPKQEKRIFQLRTYESPSYQHHILKVAMFHDGEFELFRKAGFGQVFYGDALVGQRLPCLTYLLSFADLVALDASWDRFRNDPDWQKLSHLPKYSEEGIVSNINNLILSPLACSQI